jgi:septation ring formation regulator EzrA
MSTERLEAQLSDLRHQLEAILSCVKSQHATLSAVMADVAAIRKTIFEDQDNVDLYKGHLKQTIQATRPLVDQAMRDYDLQLREIIDSQHKQWEK